MRTLALALPSLLAALLVLALPSAALAQDEFGDEFGDEFEDEPAQQQPAEQPAGEEAPDEFEAAEGEDYEQFEADAELAEDEFYTGEADTAEEPGDVDEEAWEQAYRTHNTWDGPTGGIHVAGAQSGPIDTFRLQLGVGFFDAGDHLVSEDSSSWVGGSLSVSWSVIELLELYASIQSHAASNDREDPDLFLVLGDVSLGGKVHTNITPVFSLAGDLRLILPTGIDLGVGDAIGFGIGAYATADLRGLDSPVPFIARLNLSYRFDQSENLVDQIEDERYEALDDPAPRSDETRHLVSPVERFGLGINRTDFFDIGIGLEAPLRAATDFYLSPMLEWRLGLPINRQGYSCLIEEGGEDSCIDDVGLSSFPMTLTLGIRVLPPVRGFAALAAVDIGLTGTSPEDSVRELAGNAPWKLLLAASYAFDTRAHPEPEVVVREIPIEEEVEEELPPRGRVQGFVVREGDNVPIQGAVIDINTAPELNAIVADGRGRFTTYLLPPGEVQMAITAEDYDPGQCAATIPEEGGDVQVRCELVKTPQVQVEDDEVIILEQIHFAFDSAEILEESFGLMQEIATTLNNHPEIQRVEIQGHTDNQGTPEYNEDLSQRRAESVMQWLVEHGVEADRLEAKGYGQSEPLAPNITEENRARNRRVQFIIKDRAQ